MTSRTQAIGLLCVVAALSGCAQPMYRAETPDTTTHCVDRLQDVSSHPLTFLAPKEKAVSRQVEFADVAACVTLDGTASPVALYRLDTLPGQAEIDIRVVLSEGGTFAASAELLDADFQPIRQHPFSAFVRRTNEYSLSVFVDPSRRPAPAYLLLRPDASQVGRDDRTITGQTSALQLPAGSMTFGREVTRLRPLLAGGQLQVVPYPAQRAGFDGDAGKRQ